MLLLTNKQKWTMAPIGESDTRWKSDILWRQPNLNVCSLRLWVRALPNTPKTIWRLALLALKNKKWNKEKWRVSFQNTASILKIIYNIFPNDIIVKKKGSIYYIYNTTYASLVSVTIIILVNWMVAFFNDNISFWNETLQIYNRYDILTTIGNETPTIYCSIVAVWAPCINPYPHVTHYY